MSVEARHGESRASVLAEFVGGWLDGQIRMMPDARDRWYFPARPYVSVTALASNPDKAPVLHRHLVYEKQGRRMATGDGKSFEPLDTPTGEPVVRYVFMGES